MSGENRIALLTPKGTGAIATLEVSGPQAWEIASKLFKPAGKPLIAAPVLNRFWFGTLGLEFADEVILAVVAIEPEIRLEVHCHGGQQLVHWIIRQFRALGCVEDESDFDSTDPWQLLTRAPTLRTAAILLDQAQGAFETEVRRILALLAEDHSRAMQMLADLARFSQLGLHLVQPWKIVIAGPPNVGKSSLMNALAGFHRAIVSETPGTTRDVVTAQLAFDGWPVELADTAGLRAAEGLEAEGIARTRRVLTEADLVVWVLDSSQKEVVMPDPETLSACPLPRDRWLFALNKTDLGAEIRDLDVKSSSTIPVSALTGAGIPELVTRIVSLLVPSSPHPGAAVPFTPLQASAVVSARDALSVWHTDEAARLLRSALTMA